MVHCIYNFCYGAPPFPLTNRFQFSDIKTQMLIPLHGSLAYEDFVTMLYLVNTGIVKTRHKNIKFFKLAK